MTTKSDPLRIWKKKTTRVDVAPDGRKFKKLEQGMFDLCL